MRNQSSAMMGLGGLQRWWWQRIIVVIVIHQLRHHLKELSLRLHHLLDRV
jgi:hypothetical protein